MPFGGGCPCRYLPGEQPVRERGIRNEGESEPFALGEHVALGVAMKEAVLVLHADEMDVRLCGLRLAKLLGGEVGAADFAHLARLHEPGERAECVGDRH